MTSLRRLLVDFAKKLSLLALGAAVVDRDGSLEIDVVGNRERGGSVPVTVDDQWHIGSCGKAITAALYARLAERGDTGGVPIVEFFP